MRTLKRYIASFDPVAIQVAPERAKYPAAPPMEIEAVGDNEVRITIGGVSRVIDGISLSNAINEVVHNYRCRT